MKFNREKFFAGYKKAFGSLNQPTVDGLNFLLGKVEEDERWLVMPQVAYFLATIKRETGDYQPKVEHRAKVGTALRKVQDRYWGSGFFGRGYIQLTWDYNYAKFGIKATPEKALEPDTAYEIAARGMLSGIFTGRPLTSYVNEEKKDYLNARRVVNGLDHAAEIAKNAELLEHILDDSLEGAAPTVGKSDEASALLPVAPVKPEPSAVEQQPVVEVKNEGMSWTTKIASAGPALTAALGATGLKLSGIEFHTGGLIAFAAIVVVAIIVGAILYDRGQERAQRRLEMNVNNMADPNRNNVVGKQ